MNKLPCNVILDLLPLYADEVASPESRMLIEQHLSECPNCRKALEDIRAEVPVPQHSDDEVLDKIRKKQNRKRIFFGIFAALWVVLILAFPATFLYLNFRNDPNTGYGPDNFIISETEDGKPLLMMDEEALGAMVYYLYERTSQGETDLYLYIYGKDPTPEWLHNVLNLQWPTEPFYQTYEIGPLYNLGIEGDGAHAFSNYFGVRGFVLDSSIRNVYYQPITSQEQNDFYYNYLHPYFWITPDYTIPETFDYVVNKSPDRLLIWTAE